MSEANTSLRAREGGGEERRTIEPEGSEQRREIKAVRIYFVTEDKVRDR